MSMEVLVPVAGILAVFAAMLVVLKIMRSKGLSFTARVFTALGLGVLLGLGIQLLLGRDGDAATTALDWISIVGQGYIGLLKMLVMPLVFVASSGRSRARRSPSTSGASPSRCWPCCWAR